MPHDPSTSCMIACKQYSRTSFTFQYLRVFVLFMLVASRIPVQDVINAICASSSQHALLHNNLLTGYTRGVLKNDNYSMQLIQLPDSSCTLLVADSENQLRVWKSDGDMLLEATPTLLSHQILDLTLQGDRWEGTVHNNMPYGYGTYFDEIGNIKYTGFMFEDEYCCQGVIYHPGTSVIEYSGQICGGKRFGYGHFFNRRDQKEYEGLSIDGLPLRAPCTFPWICSRQASFQTSPACDKDLQIVNLPLNYTPNIQSIHIGKGCFSHLPCLRIVDLPYLEELLIEAEAFMFRNGRHLIGTEECYIQNCPALRTIQIQQDALSKCSTLVMEKLDCLQSLEIGLNCFWSCSSFSLCSMCNP